AELMESEFFGHAAGAFTGARQQRSGLFKEADGGTLLLDEIAEMPLLLQAKLLRVLQEGTIRPVGSDQEVKINVRIVAATHQNLEQGVAAGT
ncbi:sigma 54-interacting transcriptional regulator, partial [Streptomyces scabiei]